MAARFSGLRNVEYPKGSGIKLREKINRCGNQTFNGSVQVTVPAKITGTVLKRKQFKEWEMAELWADEQFRGFKKQGEDFFQISDEERREFVNCLPKLKKAGISLSEAIEFAIRRFKPEGGKKSANEVVNEIAGSKRLRFERGDLKEKSYRDFF
ncbi:MAG: hypothetical protein KJT03_18620, partial [Verrucomicrobiae bacterium]|nr:hypothetical protein [Verrucomicrobiae bacterium]